jgi:UDP-4-amino-4-deoxy-L-arabinose formyltransferase/UDP-glucuronic acid dehydrogenase (UDP-4-keto-hexauronic acid decarboxylating)
MYHRKPSIRKAQRLLGWSPTVGLEQSVERTLDFFLQEAVISGEFGVSQCGIE